MTMTPEEKLAMARECAAAVDQTACWKIARERVINDATLQDLEHHLHVVTTEATALLAIDRMQERVRAETERCEGIVAARMKTLAALGGKFASQRFMEAEMILKAIRETPHAEG